MGIRAGSSPVRTVIYEREDEMDLKFEIAVLPVADVDRSKAFYEKLGFRLDADFTTRQVLLDVTGEDAPAMLRTWGEVVQSASELWATLPEPVRGATSPIDGVTMRRLESMSQGMHRTQVRQGWPGDGPADERLLHVAETLTRAADLIGRRGAHIRPTERPTVEGCRTTGLRDEQTFDRMRGC